MDAPSPALSLQPQAHGKAPLFLPAWSSWSSFASMGDEGFHDREAFISMSFLPIFQERLSCLGGPEVAGQAPRTAERQMPPAAEAQTQELAPKSALQA
jgi:hypothetical protein